MAKSYAQRNRESIAKTGKTLYQRRLESGKARGLSPQAARGHAKLTTGRSMPSGYIRSKSNSKGEKFQTLHTSRESALRTYLQRQPDSASILFRLDVGGKTLTVVGGGKGNGVSVKDLKQEIANNMSSGMTFGQAFTQAILAYGSIYDDDDNIVDDVDDIADYGAWVMY